METLPILTLSESDPGFKENTYFGINESSLFRLYTAGNTQVTFSACTFQITLFASRQEHERRNVMNNLEVHNCMRIL